jgi:hypothetical protein
VKSPTPDELRKLIDEALAEIEETEHNVIALFEDLGGPDLATRLLTYYERAEEASRLRPLKQLGGDSRHNDAQSSPKQELP